MNINASVEIPGKVGKFGEDWRVNVLISVMIS